MLAYALNPFDLLPDVVVGWGWIDDLILMALVYYFFLSGRFRPRTGPTDDPNARTDRQQKREECNRSGSAAGKDPVDDPYAVLKLNRDASREAIQKAFRRQSVKYHPDKVAHLGEEFRDLAEEKFKKIQAAYDTLIQKER